MQFMLLLLVKGIFPVFVCQLSFQISHMQIIEMERILSSSVSKLQKMLSQGQKFVLGCQRHTTDVDKKITSSLTSNAAHTSLVPYSHEECEVTVNYFDNKITKEMGVLLKNDKPSHTDLESLLVMLEAKLTSTTPYTYSDDDISVPGSMDSILLKACSAKYLRYFMCHMGGDDLDKFFGIAKCQYTTAGSENADEQVLANETLASLESTVLGKNILSPPLGFTNEELLVQSNHHVYMSSDPSTPSNVNDTTMLKCTGKSPDSEKPNKYDRPNTDQLRLVKDHLTHWVSCA